MKLRANNNKAILDDSLGQIINACAELYPGARISLIYVQPPELQKMIKEKPDDKGTPHYFSFKIGSKETEFYFFPKADKDYEIQALYYPAPKMG